MADTYYLGDVIYDGFTLASGAGATMSRTSSSIDGVSTIWNPSFSDTGSGSYLWTYTPTTTGMFVWEGLASTGEGVSINFVVRPSLVAVEGAYSRTLRQLRRQLAARFNDYEAITATGTGTSTTIVDSDRINLGYDSRDGCQVLGTSGTNDGVIRSVLNTNKTTFTLTLNRALSASTAANDTFDLFHHKGINFTIDEYDHAINAAIVESWGIALIEAKGIVTGYASDDPYITVPTEMTEVYALEMLDEEGTPHRIRRARTKSGEGWFPDKADGTIRLSGYSRDLADGYTFWVWGYGKQSELNDDDDTCNIDAAWLIAKAAYYLCVAGMTMGQDFSSRVALYRDESITYKPRLRVIRHPESVAVRAI